MTGLSATAADRKSGLTLGELAAWVEQARLLEFGDATPVKATTGLRGQLVEIGTR